MRFKHIRAYAVRGLTLPAGTDGVTLVDSSPDAFKVRLCGQSDPLLEELDRRIAVADVALDGAFGGSGTGTIEERLTIALAAERERRERLFGAGPYLLLERSGTVDSFDTSHQVERSEFVVCLDGHPGRPARGVTDEIADSLIAAVAVTADAVLAVTPVGEATVFTRADGKTVYSLSLSMSGSGHVSSPITTEAIGEVPTWFDRLSSEPNLSRVVHLLVTSLALDDDRLRAFLSAWSALEILIAKLFSAYEAQFFDAMASSSAPVGQRKYVGRIREVMKDKYRLTDKFALIASQLDPSSSDADIESFARTKDQRDRLLHGDDIPERQFMIRDAQRLARKYLRLHLETLGRTA
jgi:hypothetical protein